MPESAPRTRLATLHRLCEVTRVGEVPPLIRGDVLGPGMTGDLDGEFLDIGGVPAVWFWAQRPDSRPAWYRDASTTVGRELDVWARDCGVLVALEVDGAVYTVTYGEGWRWIADEHRSPSFGLGVVVRCLDTEKVRAVASRRLGLGWSNSTHVAGGASLAAVRPGDYLDVVRKLAGEAVDLGLTHGRVGRDGVTRATLDGAAGLRARLGVRGDHLVADIRRVAAIAREPVPQELAFVHVVTGATPAEAVRLDALLAAALEGPAPGGAVAVAVPDAALPGLGSEHGYRLTSGSRVTRVEELHVDDVLEAFRPRRRGGRRLELLKRGRIAMLGEETPRPLADAPALRWLESVQHLDDVAYYLMDGVWYRFDADYARGVRAGARAAFRDGSGLPAWPRLPDGSPQPEGDYNEHVARETGLICLDKKLLRSELYRRSGLEVCDLLGEDGALVHVKRAKGAAALSHLFVQGLGAVEALQADAGLRQRLRALVARTAPDRRLPDDLMPTRLVFGIAGEAGPLTADSLYPLSAATLAHVIARLAGRVDVTVVPIEGAPLAHTRAA